MDPGFPRGNNSLLVVVLGVPIYCFEIFFCRKLHENESICPGMGGDVTGAPLDPPLVAIYRNSN